LTYQIKNMKVTPIQSSCKKSCHSSLLPKNWLDWKNLPWWWCFWFGCDGRWVLHGWSCLLVH